MAQVAFFPEYLWVELGPNGQFWGSAVIRDIGRNLFWRGIIFTLPDLGEI